MPKVLIMSHGRVAMFHAISTLAARLNAAGHSVIYASPDDIGPRATVAGLTWLQLPDGHIDGDDGDPRQTAAQALGVADLPETIRQLDPDLLLIDIELHPQILRSMSLGLPIGLLSPFISITKRRGLPPLHSSAVPGRGWRGSALHAEFLWARFRARKALQRWLDPLRLRGRDPISMLCRLAQESGVRLAEVATFSQWLIPFSYRHLPVLSLTASELDFSSRPAPGVHHCGPMLRQDRQERPLPKADRSRLDSLYERRLSGTSEALILCSLSTFLAADLHFIDRLAAAVGNQPGWDLVLALGGNLSPDALGSLPENVHPFVWIPQMEALRLADCAVINAGTSISECIHHGVPMVVYSLRFNDQNGNAARVDFHRLGIVGNKDRDDPVRMRSDLHRVLTEPSFRQRLVDMGRKFAAYDIENRAVQAVEALLAVRGSTLDEH